MIPVQFCNYNLDYQQRLGFLKILVWAGQGVRGGKEELQRRVESLYTSAASKAKRSSAPGVRITQPVRAGRHPGSFDPEAMLQVDRVPSWQPGFSFQRLDRLILWGEMLGLITSGGRLSEWSKPLISEYTPPNLYSPNLPNPFEISERERAYFLALLMYHDQTLLHLTSSLSLLGEGKRIETREACVQVVRALGKTLDCASGTNIRAVRTRQTLRLRLERIAEAEQMPSKHALLNESERTRSLAQMSTNRVRDHLAEYHAICRFEQLTDLGLLVKEDPRNPPKSKEERERARKSWVWYTTNGLKVFATQAQLADCNVERYLQDRWAQSCFIDSRSPHVLDAARDQQEIAGLLDAALPKASRQLGAIQVHTWVFIAALDAINRGLALEFSQAFALLDAMRHDARYSTHIRLSGQQSYLGRIALVMSGSMEEQVRRYPIEVERGSNGR